MTFHHMPPHIAAEHARERAALHALRQGFGDTFAAFDRAIAGVDLVGAMSDEKRRFVDLSPDELPDEYAMTCVGDCLEPVVPDGSHMHISRVEPYQAGDLVILYMRPELVPPGHFQGILKRLVMSHRPGLRLPAQPNPRSNIRDVVVVEMFNPRRQWSIRCENLLGIHKCLGILPADRIRVPTSEETLRQRARAAVAAKAPKRVAVR